MKINETNEKESNWQCAFLAMLPEIEMRARRAFSFLDAEARAEAVCETVAHCVFDFVRLHDRGCMKCATAATFVRYAARHVKRGRPAAGRMNHTEILSRYGQLTHGFRVQQEQGTWLDSFVEDRRASVLDVVALKIDFRTWFGMLTKSMKEIAKDLAYGFSTSEVAKKHGVTAGRVSQIRRMLAESWFAYQDEAIRTHLKLARRGLP
jgi:hypothetical protein